MFAGVGRGFVLGNSIVPLALVAQVYEEPHFNVSVDSMEGLFE